MNDQTQLFISEIRLFYRFFSFSFGYRRKVIRKDDKK